MPKKKYIKRPFPRKGVDWSKLRPKVLTNRKQGIDLIGIGPEEAAPASKNYAK
tara:strand:- start:1270 stop:1428 length:159 start_codon:yes stop_codon:yes gene_type:complete